MARFGRSLWRRGTILALAALAALLWAPPGSTAERLPIFDTHVHYSRDVWEALPPAAILEKLDRAGVPRALVSSTPDAGTLALHQAAPTRVAPFLRPYRKPGDMANWFRDPEVLAYLNERLALGRHVGIGEFHLMDPAEAGTPEMRAVIGQAVARGLFLHVHSGAGQIAALFEIEPRLKIVWAHAGMGAPPEVIGPLLDRYDTLWTELSFRAEDVAQGPDIEPDWRALLLRHADRFMIGTDTYTLDRWEAYWALVERQRTWVSRLPPEAARAIAYGNAVRLFGAGKAAFWP
ncbi:MAG: amidohydrolase family protein [Kiloniellales bacterium]